MAATATTDVTSTSRKQRPRAVYTRIETLGLALVAAVPVIFLTATVVSGSDLSEAGFFAMPLAIGTVAAVLVWRFGTWAKVVGILASLAAGLTMFWAAFGLAYPSSFADFVPGLMLPLGVVLGVGGGIAAIVRRKRTETHATVGERRIMLATVALVAIAAVVSGALHLVGRTAAEATGAAATVTMADFEFDPASYEVASGESLLVHNSDAFVHTFTVPELGIDETILPGSRQLLEISGDAGSYTIYCRPHADLDATDLEEAGMAASLTIR